jgi:hypothetical protein
LNLLKYFGISGMSVSQVEILAGSMEGKHFVITCTLTVNNQEIPTHALIECTATGIAFMDQDFACHHQIPLHELKETKHVEVIDGRHIEFRDITQIGMVGMMIQDHGEHLPLLVTKMGHYPIDLGITCLPLYDVAVQFASNTSTFGSKYCITH